MRALIQRAKWGRVVVEGETIGEIGPGIITLLGIGANDTEADVEKIIGKIAKLRIFEDDAGKMNLSLQDLTAAGKPAGHLIISQFTLYGDTSKGNRPSFISAGKPELAKALYEKAITISKSLGIETASGQFQAQMDVSLLNDGPVTFWLENET